MTGPSEGKVPLGCSTLLDGREIECAVYIHLKGFAGATVTHLDIESPDLNLMDGEGSYGAVVGVTGGIKLKVAMHRIEVRCHALNRVLSPGERTFTWIGQKKDGIFVGFRKAEMEKLDALGRSKDFEGSGATTTADAITI
ncbi:MAG: hypothetical protein AB1665_09010 [Candidatus Thermoplasmatota archaeon]